MDLNNEEERQQYEDDDYISPSQASKLVNVARSTINYWIRNYGLKTKKSPGGRYKILYSDFKAFLKFNGKNQGVKIRRNSSKYKIAVIDSAKIYQDNYNNWLGEQYQVKIINDISKGLKSLKRFMPHIIIFEVVLDNNIDGFKILEDIKNEISLSSSIVFIISKKYDEEDVVHGFELGVRDYVKKPVGKNELKARINNILRNIIDM